MNLPIVGLMLNLRGPLILFSILIVLLLDILGLSSSLFQVDTIEMSGEIISAGKPRGAATLRAGEGLVSLVKTRFPQATGPLCHLRMLAQDVVFEANICPERGVSVRCHMGSIMMSDES